mmetsp:Transcript_34161/g.77948  ORF Transcript_34161/g.77948 Transcript_34161/m.77948 type:complete len:326 (+) Transcript_34161:247-1224(+)
MGPDVVPASLLDESEMLSGLQVLPDTAQHARGFWAVPEESLEGSHLVETPHDHPVVVLLDFGERTCRRHSLEVRQDTTRHLLGVQPILSDHVVDLVVDSLGEVLCRGAVLRLVQHWRVGGILRGLDLHRPRFLNCEVSIDGSDRFFGLVMFSVRASGALRRVFELRVCPSPQQREDARDGVAFRRNVQRRFPIPIWRVQPHLGTEQRGKALLLLLFAPCLLRVARQMQRRLPERSFAVRLDVRGSVEGEQGFAAVGSPKKASVVEQGAAGREGVEGVDVEVAALHLAEKVPGVVLAQELLDALGDLEGCHCERSWVQGRRVLGGE